MSDVLALANDYQRRLPDLLVAYHAPWRETTVAGATPGAFQHAQAGPAGHKPSAYDIYNDWAFDALKAVSREKATIGQRLASQDGYDAWHAGLLTSLHQAWAERAHPDHPLTRRQAHKLVNLFAKWLRTKARSAPGLSEALLAHAHVPLNTPTLDLLRRMGANGSRAVQVPSEQAGENGEAIGFDAWYQQHQALVRAFTQAHGGSPILLDVYARREATVDGGDEG